MHTYRHTLTHTHRESTMMPQNTTFGALQFQSTSCSRVNLYAGRKRAGGGGGNLGKSKPVFPIQIIHGFPFHIYYQIAIKNNVNSTLLLLLSRFSRVRLCVTPQTAVHQAPPSLGFSRQEYWSGLPFPSPMHESKK